MDEERVKSYMSYLLLYSLSCFLVVVSYCDSDLQKRETWLVAWTE